MVFAILHVTGSSDCGYIDYGPAIKNQVDCDFPRHSITPASELISFLFEGQSNFESHYCYE